MVWLRLKEWSAPWTGLVSPSRASALLLNANAKPCRNLSRQQLFSSLRWVHVKNKRFTRTTRPSTRSLQLRSQMKEICLPSRKQSRWYLWELWKDKEMSTSTFSPWISSFFHSFIWESPHLQAVYAPPLTSMELSWMYITIEQEALHSICLQRLFINKYWWSNRTRSSKLLYITCFQLLHGDMRLAGFIVVIV